MATCSNRLTGIFGGSSAESRPWHSLFWEQLLPKPNVQEVPLLVEPFGLNPAAPEASFRLQRVGAAGGIGLIRPPIVDDGTFVDRPHRRRINLSTYAPLMAANLGAQPMTVTSGGRTYLNVIFSRVDHSWEPVSFYRLLPSTCRVWQRAEPYVISAHPTARTWHLPEPDTQSDQNA